MCCPHPLTLCVALVDWENKALENEKNNDQAQQRVQDAEQRAQEAEQRAQGYHAELTEWEKKSGQFADENLEKVHLLCSISLPETFWFQAAEISQTIGTSIDLIRGKLDTATPSTWDKVFRDVDADLLGMKKQATMFILHCSPNLLHRQTAYLCLVSGAGVAPNCQSFPNVHETFR